MNKKKLVENVFSLGFVQLVVLLTGFLSLGYFSRIFDKDTLGRMFFLLSFTQLFVILSDYGFNLSAAKDISINKKSSGRIFNIWISVTIIKSLIGTFAFILYLLFFCFYDVGKYDLQDCVISYMLVVGNILSSQWLYQGLGELRFVSMITVFARLIYFGATFIFVKSAEDFSLAVFFQSSPVLVTGLIIFPYTLLKFKNCNFEKQKISKSFELLKKNWHSFVSVAAINIYTTSNVVFLGFLTNPGVVANYNLSEKIIRTVQAIYMPMANAIYPHMSYEMTKNQDSALKFGYNFAIFSGAIAFGFGCVLAYFSSFIIDFLFGAGYDDAKLYLKIMAFVPFLSILANVYGVLLMLPMGMEKRFSKILLLAAFANIILFYFMVDKFSGVGAASANLIVEFFIFLSFFYSVIKIKQRVDVH